MRVCLVSADGKARVEHENPTFGPGSQQPGLVGGRVERGVVFPEAGIYVFQRRGRRSRGEDTERQTVGLVVVVVGVLTENYNPCGREGGVSGPVIIITLARDGWGRRKEGGNNTKSKYPPLGEKSFFQQHTPSPKTSLDLKTPL